MIWSGRSADSIRRIRSWGGKWRFEAIEYLFTVGCGSPAEFSTGFCCAKLGKNILDYSNASRYDLNMEQEPKTLQQVTVMAADPDKAREYVLPRRWADKVVCPTCGSEKVTFQPRHNRWQCTNRHPRRQFTLKTGTVMEDSPLGLDKWLMAMWLVASNRNGISSWEF